MASPQRHLYHSLKKKSIIFSFLISNRVLHRLWLVPFLNKKKVHPFFIDFFLQKKICFLFTAFSFWMKKKILQQWRQRWRWTRLLLQLLSSSHRILFIELLFYYLYEYCLLNYYFIICTIICLLNKKKQCHRIFQNWFAVPSDDLFGLVSGFFFSRVVSSSLKKRRRRHFSPPFHRKSTGSSLFLIFFVNFFFQLSPPTQPDLVSKFLYLFFLQSIAMIYFYFLK